MFCRLVPSKFDLLNMNQNAPHLAHWSELEENFRKLIKKINKKTLYMGLVLGSVPYFDLFCSLLVY